MVKAAARTEDVLFKPWRIGRNARLRLPRDMRISAQAKRFMARMHAYLTLDLFYLALRKAQNTPKYLARQRKMGSAGKPVAHIKHTHLRDCILEDSTYRRMFPGSFAPKLVKRTPVPRTEAECKMVVEMTKAGAQVDAICEALHTAYKEQPDKQRVNFPRVREQQFVRSIQRALTKGSVRYLANGVSHELQIEQ